MQGGNYSNALQAASLRDHEKVCPAPAHQGAEINTQDGNYSNALHAVSFRDHKKVCAATDQQGREGTIVTTNDPDELPLSTAESFEQILATMTISAFNLPDLGEGGQAIVNVSKFSSTNSQDCLKSSTNAS